MTLTPLMGPYSLCQWLSGVWLLTCEEIPKFGQCSKGPEMANFSVDLARPWYSDIWVKHYSRHFCESVVVHFFFQRVNISISRAWVKQITLHKGGRHHPIVWKCLLGKNWPPRRWGNSACRLPLDLNCSIEFLHLQAARLPCRIWTCRPPRLCEPIP